MNATPAVSVILPAFETPESFLRDAIESVLAQEFTDFELLVIDDGIRRTVANIVAGYPDERIRYCRNPHNLGMAATRNRGIELARGELLAFLDHDDVWLPRKLAVQTALLKARPDAAITFGPVACFGPGEPRRPEPPGRDLFLSMLQSCRICSCSCIMVRKSLLEEARLRFRADRAPCDDYDFYLRLLARHPGIYHPEVLVRYRVHAANVSGNAIKMHRALLPLYRELDGELDRLLAGRSFWYRRKARWLLRRSQSWVCRTCARESDTPAAAAALRREARRILPFHPGNWLPENRRERMAHTLRIAVVDRPPEGVTGGEKYNAWLWKAIAAAPGVALSFTGRSEYPPGLHPVKPLVPFLEWRHCGPIRRADAVFFSSSLAFRHLLLLARTRLLHRHIRCIAIQHHYEFPFRKGFRKLCYRLIELGFLRLCTDIIVPTPYPARLTAQFFPRKRLHRIPIPQELTFRPNTPEPGRMLFVGTVEPRKGLHRLIAALAILRDRNIDFKLDIVGQMIDPAYSKRLQQEIAAAGLTDRVCFSGRVSDAELTGFYQRARVFAFPSQLEGYGMAVIEAMSFGVVPVVFDNSALSETVDRGRDGLVVPDGDVEAFAAALATALTDDAQVAAWRVNMKKKIAALPDRRTFAAAVSEFLRELAATKR